MTPRQNAERMLLSALLATSENQVGAVTVTPEDMSSGQHRALLGAILQAHKAGGKATFDAIELQLGPKVKPLLCELARTVAHPTNISMYCDVIRDFIAEDLRARIRASVAKKIEGGEDVNEVFRDMQERLTAIESRYGAGAEVTTLKSAAELVLLRIRERKKPEGLVMTGYRDIDRLAIGLIGGDLVILGARPSMGKTALALGMMVNQSYLGKKPCFFSLEQSREQLAARLLANISRLSTSMALRRPHDINVVHQFELLEHSNDLVELCNQIFVFDEPRQSIDQIERRSVEAVKAGAGIIYVDYLQLIRKEKDRSREDIEIGEHAERLKAIARNTGVPVVALSQLSRQCEGGSQGKPRRPKASDLRGSGGIEQAADFIWLLHCKESELKQGGIKYFIQDKGRDAGIGAQQLWFTAETVTFHDVTSQQQSAGNEEEEAA